MKKILSLLLLLMIFSAKAQTYNSTLKMFIWLDLTISINDSIKPNQKYLIQIMNMNTNEVTGIKSISKSQIGLKYNSIYELIFTCEKCNTKIIEIDTNAPFDNWLLQAEIKLQNSDFKVTKVGKIFYSEIEKNFTKVKY